MLPIDSEGPTLNRAAREVEIARAVPYRSGAWNQRVGAFTAIPALIRHLGGEPAALLSDAGLAPDAFAAADARIPYAALVELLNVAADATGCSHFGLLAGRAWRLHDLGVVGELVSNSPTVGRALQTLVVYQRMNSDGGLAYMLERGSYVDLGYAVFHPDVFDAGQMYDAAMSAGFNFLRELCGPEWAPTEVLLPHGAPRSSALHYRNFLKGAPQFDCDLCAIRFPAQWLDRAVEGADPRRLRDAQTRAEAIVRPEFMQQVYRGLRRLLLDERHSGDEVAHVMSMHRRTLNRRLKEHGTTFQAILDQVRFDIARGLLARSSVSLDDIAATLGYAGVSPFMRTFRRWTGTTPAQWRRNNGGARSVWPPA